MRALTEIARVIVLQSAVAWSSVRVACHVPAAGSAISANQEYGAPPCRSDDLAATLPSGATSETTPSMSGFSVTTMTRSGAPFQGASGEGKIENAAASSHAGDAAMAGGSIAAKMNAAVTAAANRLARRILATFLERTGNCTASHRRSRADCHTSRRSQSRRPTCRITTIVGQDAVDVAKTGGGRLFSKGSCPRRVSDAHHAGSYGTDQRPESQQQRRIPSQREVANLRGLERELNLVAILQASRSIRTSNSLRTPAVGAAIFKRRPPIKTRPNQTAKRPYPALRRPVVRPRKGSSSKHP